MLQNAYFVAKIGADTAENERNFAKNWQLPYGYERVRAFRDVLFFPAPEEGGNHPVPPGGTGWFPAVLAR